MTWDERSFISPFLMASISSTVWRTEIQPPIGRHLLRGSPFYTRRSGTISQGRFWNQEITGTFVSITTQAVSRSRASLAIHTRYWWRKTPALPGIGPKIKINTHRDEYSQACHRIPHHTSQLTLKTTSQAGQAAQRAKCLLDQHEGLYLQFRKPDAVAQACNPSAE